MNKAIFAGGCFWCTEAVFLQLKGVYKVVSGYIGGNISSPTYEMICSGSTGHVEAIEITFKSSEISYKTLLEVFFNTHDPTQLNRQGNDIGTQYRSIILTTNDTQNVIAHEILDVFQGLMEKRGYGKIVTKIKPLEKFYYAEEYHQDYLVKNPNGYCPDHSTGVVFEKDSNKDKTDNSLLLKGKQIVVIESEFCPYCKKFRENVLHHYQGTIPLSYLSLIHI